MVQRTNTISGRKTCSVRGKSQFSSFLFLYNTIEYAFAHPDQIRVKIFYYPLEETPEQILLRFMAYLLYKYDKIVISPQELNSSKNIALDETILNKLKASPYKEILDFFSKVVVFSDSQNASGVWFECQRYAKENGTIYKEKYTYKTEEGKEQEGERFSHYEMNDPNEYRIIFYDHLSLCSPERGMDLRQTMAKLSEYFVLLRNRYKFTVVAIQQQAMNADGLEALKANKIRPTINTLGDAKTLSRDCDLCIGLFSPFRHQLPIYLKYNVVKLQDNLRFAEILINRSGQSNGIAALLFIGQCNYWCELPRPDDEVALNKVYNWLDTIRGIKIKSTLMCIINKFKKHN